MGATQCMECLIWSSGAAGHGFRFIIPAMQPMTDTSPVLSMPSEEQEQMQQTVEMFEVITQANPQDTQSLEILKEAYAKLGRQKDSLAVARRLVAGRTAVLEVPASCRRWHGVLPPASAAGVLPRLRL